MGEPSENGQGSSRHQRRGCLRLLERGKLRSRRRCPSRGEGIATFLCGRYVPVESLPTAPCIPRFGPSWRFTVTTMASADFSRPVSTCYHGDSDGRLGRRAVAGWEISQGKLWLLLSAFAGFTFVAYGMTVGHLRPLPDYPCDAGLVSGSCSSNPRLWLRLPSDSASRRTPLPSPCGSCHHRPQRTFTS
jgi:hypothetical protein